MGLHLNIRFNIGAGFFGNVNNPAVDARPFNWTRIQQIFQHRMLVLASSIAVVSCIPIFRFTGALASRSIGLLTTVGSNISRLKNGTLADRAAVITKIAALSLGIAGLATSTPIYIIASLVTDIAAQTFEMIPAFRQGQRSKGITHLLFAAVSVLTLAGITGHSLTNPSIWKALLSSAVHVAGFVNFVGICIIINFTERNGNIDGSKHYALLGFTTIISAIAALEETDVGLFDQWPWGNQDGYHPFTSIVGLGYANAFEHDIGFRNARVVNPRVMNDFLNDIDDIHHGDRDKKTNRAIALLKTLTPMNEETIARNVEAFRTYLYNQSESPKKLRAIRALEGPNIYQQEFGPLLPMERELIAHLWHYSTTYNPQEPQANVQQQRDSAQEDIINALSCCFSSDGTRVCRGGMKQWLAITVLQGRLPGVNIDGAPIPINGDTTQEFVISNEERQRVIKQLATSVVNKFYETETNRQLEDEDLLSTPEKFIATKPGIDRDEFLGQICDFMCLQGRDEAYIKGIPPNGNIFQRRWEAATKLQSAWRGRKIQTAAASAV